MSFTLIGNSVTVNTEASAKIVSDLSTSATIRVTAKAGLAYSSSSFQSSGVYAVITINGDKSSKKSFLAIVIQILILEQL